MKYLILLLLVLTGCAHKEPFHKLSVNSDLSAKVEVSCPIQTPSTAVFFAFGQSNSANHAEVKYTNSDPRIINFFLGKCYIAEDPMLGSTGKEGSVWIATAQKLLADGVYDQIIYINSGIGGQTIQELATGGHYYENIINQIRSTVGQYEITHFLYHQGEADWQTPYSVYTSYIHDLLNYTALYYPNSKFLVSITTKCVTDSEVGPQVEQAQRDIVDNTRVFQGPDTDTNIPLNLRRPDHCHFSAWAQDEASTLWTNAIEAVP